MDIYRIAEKYEFPFIMDYTERLLWSFRHVLSSIQVARIIIMLSFFDIGKVCDKWIECIIYTHTSLLSPSFHEEFTSQKDNPHIWEMYMHIINSIQSSYS